LECRELIEELLLRKKAHFYVCGDIKMAIGVSNAVSTILAGSTRNGNMTASDGELDYVEIMKQEGRYHEDIFAVLV